MVYLRNRLADYEVEVARYYMKRGAYVGAANRARGVIETYDGAPAVDDALEVMAQSYRKLGVEDLAQLPTTCERRTRPRRPHRTNRRHRGRAGRRPWWRFWN